MKKIIANILLIFFVISNVYGQKNKSPEEILNDVTLKLTSGIEASFTVSKINDKNTAYEEFAGSILMKGDKYYIDSPHFKIWYNGLDQWSYNASDDEVTVTEISPIEENSLNIMSIINNKDKYNIMNLGTETVLGKNYTKIILTTRKPEEEVIFRKVTFLFDRNMMPYSMGIEDKDGDNYVLLFTKCHVKVNLADNDFIFPRDKYKNVYFNDLR